MKEEKKKIQNNFIVAAGLLALFILYTVAIMFVDVQPIGPQGSSVGFAEVNQYFHTLFGVNMLLYSITDWLSIAVLFIMFGFAMVGLVQLIKGEFYQFNLSSCIRQQNSLTAQFVSFNLSNLANIFYPPQFLQ